jgi:WD40 repeat protein
MSSQRVHKGPVTDIKFILNDNMIASSSTDGTIILWQIEKDAKLVLEHVYESPSTKTADGTRIAGVLKMEFNPAKSELLSLGADRRVTFWDLGGEKQIIRQL